jgi:methyl-accepting chemotaxis protein
MASPSAEEGRTHVTEAHQPHQKRTTYLVNRPFQLKATAMIVGLTLLVGVPLGFLLYRTSGEAVAIGREAVDIGQTANSASTEAIKQAELLNKRLEMETILRYGNDPALLEQTKKANAVETTKLKVQADAVKAEADKLGKQRDALERMRKSLLFGVAGAIGALVLLVGIAGIFFTHKVAGPIHRMRALFREVGEGQFTPFRPLRKGDELQDFFSEFSSMVEKLKARQKAELERLDKAIARAEKAGADTESVAELRVVRDAIKDAMAKSMRPPPIDA